MGFHPTEEDLMIKKLSKEFAENEINPLVEDINENERFPVEIYQKMGELGLVGVPYEEHYGGGGGTWTQFAIVHEEISKIDSGVANAIMGNCSVSTLISTFGTEEQKKKWLPKILTGKQIGAIGLTEPNAGSDASSLKTKAELEGDEWVLNGAKTFITNSGTDITGPIVVAAVTGTAENGKKEIGTFIVPKQTDGLVISSPLKKIGWHASDTRELTFEGCRIPKENLLGDEKRGYKQALQTISTGRFLIASMAVGLAQGCLDLSAVYAKERQAFGKQLKEFQDIQFKIAEMQTKVDAARLLVSRAASLRDNNRSFAKEASMSKLYATQIANEVAREAVQIHGGYGVMREYKVALHYQSAKIFEIIEGTNEIQKMIIAREVFNQ
ncbi:acyl-CoA dehydrogenase family protein [Salicibibacter cibarius]|uniref:Acyl-CoA dehydrogenase family protein n=1 Tax=Salicibibacter cibarius TaxID=2743000 RepID=A0A7T6Z1Z2_9BACI|nr:acyl-CoA dehydrogenase family protein [Salicibibacter cibarius]QQK75382.1 acyl-CoA dehydrogenase family protein [Salicibibacter cibarius]